jgi:hypothetical protein
MNKFQKIFVWTLSTWYQAYPSSIHGFIPGLWWGPLCASLYCVFILIVFVLFVPMLFCFPWIVYSWLPSKIASIVYLSGMDIYIFLFFIAKHIYSCEASQNVRSRMIINTWKSYFYLCLIWFKIFFFFYYYHIPFCINSRRVSRYKRCHQNPLIEETQTKQWQKKDKRINNDPQYIHIVLKIE